jgi:hypothetical protein
MLTYKYGVDFWKKSLKRLKLQLEIAEANPNKLCFLIFAAQLECL